MFFQHLTKFELKIEYVIFLERSAYLSRLLIHYFFDEAKLKKVILLVSKKKKNIYTIISIFKMVIKIQRKFECIEKVLQIRCFDIFELQDRIKSN